MEAPQERDPKSSSILWACRNIAKSLAFAEKIPEFTFRDSKKAAYHVRRKPFNSDRKVMCE